MFHVFVCYIISVFLPRKNILLALESSLILLVRGFTAKNIIQNLKICELCSTVHQARDIERVIYTYFQKSSQRLLCILTRLNY